MDRLLLQAACRVKFQYAFAAEVYGADFAFQYLANGVDDFVQLGLSGRARGHDLMKATENFPGCNGGR